MKPVQDKENYRMMVQGLEKMARLYKNKKSGSPAGKSRTLWKILKNGGIAEMKKRSAVRRYGLDEPLRREGPDPSEKWRNDPERYFSEERIAVYTACMGGYDRISDPVIRPDNIDYFLITDEPDRYTGRAWQTLPAAGVVPAEHENDPVLANRWCKMHPHEIFPEYPLSVYLDSNILVVSDLTALTAALSDFPLAMFRHKNRDCVYEEIRACILKKKDTEEALKRQEALLLEHGVPKNCGLLEAPVLVRRHGQPECRELMEDWWNAFLSGSRRDQISLIDVLWRKGIPVTVPGTLGYDLRECDLFIVQPHSKKN